MTKTNKSFRKFLYVPLTLVTAIVIMVILEITNTTHFFHKTAVVRAPAKPITTLPAQSATNNGNKVPSLIPTLNQGTATDENGQVPSTGVPTDPSQWSTSTSGLITVKLPGSNSTIQSGTTLTGSSSVDQVQYRLTDDKVGVISQGSISVVNGNFTASINFMAHGNTGRLDVFSTDSTGKEYNEVQIPINF